MKSQLQLTKKLVKINAFQIQTLLLPLRRWSSSATEAFTVTEVQVPSQDGNYLAGKLWKGIEDPTFTKRIAPIVCLHGWLDNAGSFDSLLPLIIKPNMTVLAIDLPGHGLSSHFSDCTHYDPFDGFLSIHRIIRHFGFHKVILLAHSMGSVLSFICTGVFPELIDAYIALDNVGPISKNPLIYIRKVAEKILKTEEILKRKLPPPAYPYDGIVERSYIGRGKNISIEDCKILLKRGAMKRPDGKYHFTHDLRVTIPTSVGRFTAEQSAIIASAIQCPVCIIKAEPGIDFEPREELLKIVDIIRKCSSKKVEFHLVPGTHHIHLERPELIAPIINNFLWNSSLNSKVM